MPRQTKSAEKSAETPKETPLRVPEHGRGMIRVGNPGNAGGGRPPSQVRQALRESFEARLPVLEEIADDPEVAPKERIRAVDVLGKYGLGEKNETTVVSPEVQARLQATVNLISQKAPALLDELEAIWN